MKRIARWRLPYWLGVIGLGMTVGTGCNSEPNVITSQTSKYEVADGSAPSEAGSPGAGAAAVPGTATPGIGSAPTAAGAAGDIGAGGGSAAREPGTAAAVPPAADASSGAAPPRPSSTPPPGVQGASAQSSVSIDRNDPKQLAAYLEELLNRPPRGATRDEAMSRYEATQNEVIEVATAILALPADEATLRRAAEGKVQALTILSQLGRKQADEDLRVFLASLAKSEHADLARFGKRMGFAQRMDAAARGDLADSAKILKEFEGLFTDEKKDHALFVLGNQVARMFMQQGKNAEALTVMKVTHQAFQGHPDPQVAAQARSLAEEIRMVELDFNARLVAFMQGAPNADQALFQSIEQLLASPDVGQASLEVLLQVAQVLEGRDLEAAARVHEMNRAAFSKHANAALAKSAVASADSFARRKAIVGQPFEVEGTLMNGTPFDWSKYRGKVVLVDFWATWCGPCLQEMPNIRMNYDQYHEQGFEVVGINLDDNMQALEQFFSVQKFPWTTVLSPDPNKTGFEHPLAVKCGVEFIPFIVLVGRDGKALALNVRGEELGRRLAELFPAAGAPAAPARSPAREKTSATRPAAGIDPARSLTALEDRVRGVPKAIAGGASVAVERQTASSAPRFVLARADNAVPDPEASTEEEDSNPYLAPSGLSVPELVDFLLEMEEKPQSIQQRPGFAAALVDAADRVLAGGADDRQQRIAIRAGFAARHRLAEAGDPVADRQLVEFARRFHHDTREEVVREVKLVQAQQAAFAAKELPLDKLPAVLSELQAFLEKEKELTGRHVRMASAIVEAINRMGEDDFREDRFKEFGQLFARSTSRELARYGQRLMQQTESKVGEWIGKPVELSGTTVLGESFDGTRLRGRVVVVDVWASWCAPCREEMPRLKALHEKLSPQGLEVVGVSVDKDTSALAKYLEEFSLPWANLAGPDALDFARRLGIRGIPTLLLLDRDGRMVSVSHAVTDLAPRAETLLAASR